MRDIDTLRMILGGASKPKARKPRSPSIKVGMTVSVWGHKGTVVGKSEINPSWWNVEVDNPNGPNEVFGFARDQIQL